jgi:ParB family chromosome partitioning protein
LNVRQVEKIVRDFNKKPEVGKFKVQTSGMTEFSDLEEKLRQIFGTKVKISSKGEGKGEVVIDYYSILDLERLIELFMIIKSHS